MIVKFSKQFDHQLKKLAEKDQKTFSIFKKKLVIFSKDPTNSTLRVHKLSGNLADLYVFPITYSIRVVFAVEEDEVILLIAIGSHDEVYRG